MLIGTNHVGTKHQTQYTEGDKYLTIENYDVPLHHYSRSLGLVKHDQDFLDRSEIIKHNDITNKKLEDFMTKSAEELAC